MSADGYSNFSCKKGFSMNIAGWVAVTTAWLLIGLALKYGYGVNS